MSKNFLFLLLFFVTFFTFLENSHSDTTIVRLFKKLKSVYYGPPKEDDPYDVILDIQSLQELNSLHYGESCFDKKAPDLNAGWNFFIKDSHKYKMFQKQPHTFVSVLGGFNKGKTWLLNKLSGKNLASGHTNHTRGISLKFPENEAANKVAFFDTAGEQTSVQFAALGITEKKEKMDYFQDRESTQHFIRDFILQTSDVVIFVVNQLTDEDQGLLNRIKFSLRSFDDEKIREIIIVHNFMNIRKNSAGHSNMERQIKKDIIDMFDAKKHEDITVAGKIVETLYLSPKNKPKYYHYVMGNDEDFGKENDVTKEAIVNRLVKNGYKSKLNLQESVKLFAKHNLENYIRCCDRSITKVDMVYNEKNEKEGKLVLKNCKSFESKKLMKDSFDNFVFKMTLDSFAPDYDVIVVYYNDTKDIIYYKINAEISGIKSSNLKALDCNMVQNEDEIFVMLSGNRKMKKYEGMRRRNVRSSTRRKFGKFSLKIPIYLEDRFDDDSDNDSYGMLFSPFSTKDDALKKYHCKMTVCRDGVLTMKFFTSKIFAINVKEQHALLSKKC